MRASEFIINEFAVDDDGDEEHSLRKYARMWYNGNDHTQHHVEKILDRMGWEIGEIESEDGGVFVVQSGDEHGKSYIGFPPEELTENFADGRHPEDKGDSKRYGVPTKASVSTLRKVAHQGGRKGQLAHWMANMKAGREKAKHHESTDHSFAGAKVGQKAGPAGQLKGNAKPRKDGKQPVFNKLVGGT
jgi:hypothetical protein